MATIKDVANRAGVSTATVSYVINKNRYVSDELTQRVLEAIKELNFTPSKVAQSLRRGKTSIIGLIMDDTTVRRRISLSNCSTQACPWWSANLSPPAGCPRF